MTPAPNENRPVRFLTIGTSPIVETMLRGAHLDPRFVHSAVYSRRQDTASAFAARHGVEHTFTDLEQAACSDTFDAAYIASPNSLHFAQTMLLLSHGKHVLCEKPLASNARQAGLMCRTAQEKGLVLMEGLKTTLTPTFAAVREALPRIAPIRRYFAAFCQRSSRYDRFLAGEDFNVFSPEFSGGSLLDIGIYGLYPMVVLFGPPEEVVSRSLLLRTGVDGQGSLLCRYPQMEGVVVHSKIADSSLPSEIQGEGGRILIERINSFARAQIVLRNGSREDLSVEHAPFDMVYEVSTFIDLICRGGGEHPVNSFAASIATAEIMDAARAQNGIRFPSDRL